MKLINNRSIIILLPLSLTSISSALFSSSLCSFLPLLFARSSSSSSSSSSTSSSSLSQSAPSSFQQSTRHWSTPSLSPYQSLLPLVGRKLFNFNVLVRRAAWSCRQRATHKTSTSTSNSDHFFSVKLCFSTPRSLSSDWVVWRDSLKKGRILTGKMSNRRTPKG